MKTLSFWKKPLYSAMVFFGTLMVLSVGYSLVGNLSTADKVGSGSGLTAASWNKIVDGVLDLDSRLSNLSFSGGNVGIGTASPNSGLEIIGQATPNSLVTIGAISQSADCTTINCRVFRIAGDTSPWTEIFTVLRGGNVGIGAATPKAKLEVNGDFIRTIARAQGYNQISETDNGAIATRILTFVKKQSDTGIRVTYSDGRRVYSTTGAAAGRWEARFNAASCANPGLLAWDLYEGVTWENHHRTDTTVGTCFGLAAGTYTIQIYVGTTPGQPAADLYTGFLWAWSLEAEEVR